MNVLDHFDAVAEARQPARDSDPCLEAPLPEDTAQILDDLLGRHEDDDFPASSESELLAALED